MLALSGVFSDRCKSVCFDDTIMGRIGVWGCLLLVLVCPVRTVHAQMLHPEVHVAQDGQERIAVMHITIPEEFHAYAHNPGEAGRPTTVTFSVEGGSSLPVYYPEGTLQRDFYDPSATIYVYAGDIDFFIPLPPDASGKSFSAGVSLLLCSNRKCQPVHEQVKGIVPQSPPLMKDTSWAVQWAEARRSSFPTTGDGGVEESGGQYGAEASFNGIMPNSAPAPLPSPENFGLQLTPRYPDTELEITGIGRAILFGMLAGLLLNVMPCVLPVLTLKVSGLLLVSGRKRDGLRCFREHNLLFAAGIMTFFTALALILGFTDLMWGQLYQNQAVLLVMLIMVFLMGLSALGVFSLPVIDIKTGRDANNPRCSAYVTGLVSTFLATPCSGPMLGGVLAWAFTQPLFVLMAVFWSVGIGMALPYLLLSLWPSLAHILPKPGRWMQTFERIVGFLLLGTALYLLSLLPAEKYMPVLSVLLVLSLCAWLCGRYLGVHASLRGNIASGIFFVVFLLGAVFWVLRPVEPLPQWHAFMPETFEANLGKRAMLLEFTADWCPNCKFLEATVLTDERMRTFTTRYGMELVRVDFTTANAYAMRLLEALGSRSLPLTALFPSGDTARQPLVLRDMYGIQTLELALESAFGK